MEELEMVVIADQHAKGEITNFYFTFGFGQEFPNGYVKITVPAGPNAYRRAREEMVRKYEQKWAFQYDEENFLPQLKKYPLWEVK